MRCGTEFDTRLILSNVQKNSSDFISSLLHHLFGWISSSVLTASSSVTTRQSLNKFISALAVSSVLAMVMTEASSSLLIWLNENVLFQHLFG